MRVTVTLVLPAAGLATRINGLPKFALPVREDAVSLIRLHVEAANRWGAEAIVGTRPEWESLVRMLLAGTHSRIHTLETTTGSETVQRLAAECPVGQDLVVSLPDTWVSTLEADFGELLASFALQESGRDPVQAVAVTYVTDPLHRGKLGTCLIDNGRVTAVHDKRAVPGGTRHWGMIGARRETWARALDPATPHAGYLLDALLAHGGLVAALASPGQYVDCGTIRGYFGALQETLAGA